MTEEELVNLAKIITKDKDRGALPILADAMEEIGDIRAVAVRKHAFCCFRGMGIAQNLSMCVDNICYSSEDIDDDIIWDDESTSSPDPAQWGCLPS